MSAEVVLVSRRGEPGLVRELNMRCDGNEIPAPLDDAKSDSNWVAMATLSDAATPSAAHEVGALPFATTGPVALTIVGSRLLAIVAPESPSSDAAWVAAPIRELSVASSGTKGTLRSRPASVWIRGASWEMELREVARLFPHSGSYQAGQEESFVNALSSEATVETRNDAAADPASSSLAETAPAASELQAPPPVSVTTTSASTFGAPTTDKQRCEYCGRSWPAHAEFCGSCGHPLRDRDDVPQESVSREAAECVDRTLMMESIRQDAPGHTSSPVPATAAQDRAIKFVGVRAIPAWSTNDVTLPPENRLSPGTAVAEQERRGELALVETATGERVWVEHSQLVDTGETSKPGAPDSVQCPNCKGAWPTGSQFCGNCGASLDGRAAAPSTPRSADHAASSERNAFQPTHRVPNRQLPTWDRPENSRPPSNSLNPGLRVRVLGDRAGWAHIECSNGWRAWVEFAALDPIASLTGAPSSPGIMAPGPFSHNAAQFQSHVPYPAYAAPRSVNGLAIASMVLGIVWVYWIGSILAVIFGHVALGQIKRAGGRQSGRGMAIAGVVLGWIGVATLIYFVVIIASLSSRT